MARMRARERRRQLLEVAAELFAQHGYHGTTTAMLAEAAGITEPILYRHFDNKLDLFVTLINEVGREVIAAWRTALADIDDPDQRLRVLLDGNPATHAHGRSVYRVIFQAMTEVDSGQEIGRPLRQHLGRLHRFVRDEIEALQEDRVVRSDQSADALAWFLVNIAVGYGMVRPLGVHGRPGLSQRRIQDLIHDLIVS
ncbi:MAG: TetR/AcrR family transcriptional regulator [Planctomycetota bacterium]|jgi:AcrR family transcriptional regulator